MLSGVPYAYNLFFNNGLILQYGRGYSSKNIFLPITYTYRFTCVGSGDDGTLWSTAISSDTVLNQVYLYTANSSVHLVYYISIGI